ncbi:hypothetical protein [Bacteroides sp.]|uniref:hypothetical protein n=1 Tax=Bacteroides sp. TaxID=29523 RepID=UPI002A804232|nr:hypothetical protein [Bacteroides sp.]
MIISLFRLLLHPLFKWVYKYDFENLENTIKIHREVRARNDKEIQDLKSKLDGFRYWEKNMKAVIKGYKWNSLALTSKDEIVVISSNGDDMHSIDIVLTNLRSRYGVRCCCLGADTRENGHILSLLKKVGVNDIDSSNMVTVCNIQCSEKNNGYGSTLLSYFIERAQKQQIEIVGGWLSSTPPDGEHHEELERFYRRLQFDVYFLPEGNEGVIIRKIKR